MTLSHRPFPLFGGSLMRAAQAITTPMQIPLTDRSSPGNRSARAVSQSPSFFVVPANIDQCGAYVAGKPNIHTCQAIDPSGLKFPYRIVCYPIQNLLEQQKLIVWSHYLRSLTNHRPLVAAGEMSCGIPQVLRERRNRPNRERSLKVRSRLSSLPGCPGNTNNVLSRITSS